MNNSSDFGDRGRKVTSSVSKNPSQKQKQKQRDLRHSGKALA
jgi:hypothetical protein